MSGLAITRLTLAMFRSHRAADLVFDGLPVAIWGPNGAGKTNILEAVSLLSPGRGLRRAMGGDLARRPEALGWRVRAEVRGLTGSHLVETSGQMDGPREVRIDGKAVTQTALGGVSRVLWLVPAMDRIWIEAAEGRRRFLDRIVLSFIPEHGDVSLAYDKAMRERNRLLKDGVTDPHWYGALEAQMAETGERIAANRRAALLRLAEAGEGAFPRADLSLTGEVEDLGRALAEGRGADRAAGRTLVGPHRVDLLGRYAAKGMAADQCSTGEQKALLISLILANARALAADLGRAPVILLDEVAAHLDPGRRAALYDEICALGAQAIMTGTEEGLFDNLGARAQSFQLTEEGGASWISDRG